MPYESIPGTSVQIVTTPETRGAPDHAVLDLDGTVSILRDGWQDSMVPLMVEILEACPEHETRNELESLVIDFVDHLTGKQTIYQMIRLGEEVEKRGGIPQAPLAYKQMYNDRLTAKLEERHRGLRDGSLDADDYIVPGARSFLEALRERGVRCYIASGTDAEFVREECDLLKLSQYFDGGIFGALSDYKNFSKAMVIQKIIEDFKLEGPEMMIVGDGYVEIQNAREVGAIALGVFSKENNQYHMNADKRDRLIRAGAHFLTPDLEQGAAVLDWLSGEAQS